MSENKTTALCEIMNRYGSDKGSGHHNYTIVYDHLFKNLRDKHINVLEIGIGSINPQIRSNMCGCKDYRPGASLRGWKEYFPNASIFGCDIDRSILFTEDRITTFYFDQIRIDEEIIRKLNVTFDIIIDDGIHHLPYNLNCLKNLYKFLNPGGHYIIEDILNCQYNDNILKDLFFINVINDGDIVEYHEIPNPKNTSDNNMLILVKH